VTPVLPAARGRPTFRAYGRLLAVGPLVDLAYRFSSLARLVFLFMRIYLFYALWSAVYQPGQVVAGLNARQAVTYSVLAALQGWAAGGMADSIQGRVYDGSIIFLFLRPFPVLRYFFVQRLGSAAYGLIWLVLGGLIGWAVGLVMPPASPAVLGIYLASTLLAQLVAYHLQLLFSMTAFWTVRTTGLSMLYSFIVQLLGGAIVPIWFFPGWLQRAALWLPFQAMASTPLSLYVGRLPASAAAGALALQALWCLVLAALARLLFAVAERRVVVHGG
jgi:ABC-2 type transport system permease protein